MKLTLLVVFALLPLASGASIFSNVWAWPYKLASFWGDRPAYYNADECQCTSTRISIEEKLDLITHHNDHDKNDLVTYSDFVYDITNRYDKNNDNLMSESECLQQFRCGYGDTDQVAQFMCATILGGEKNSTITRFNAEPFITGVPIGPFRENNRGLYLRFFQQGCANEELTIDEKLARNARNNDFNNDGIVTAADIENDLSRNYDANGDGQVTKPEFVSRWVCNYADSGDYARYVWASISQGAAAVPVNFLSNIEPIASGILIADFTANNRLAYEEYRKMNADNYIKRDP